MLLIEWAHQNRVNHSILDEQHRGLVSIINTLQYFIDEKWPVSSLNPTIEALEQYVMFHFKTEETILLKNGMPQEDMQKVRAYRSKFFQELREHVNSAIFQSETQLLTNFLVDWWAGHQSEFHDKLANYFDQYTAATAANI